MNGESLIKIAFTILRKIDKLKAQWSPIDKPSVWQLRKTMNEVGDI